MGSEMCIRDRCTSQRTVLAVLQLKQQGAPIKTLIRNNRMHTYTHLFNIPLSGNTWVTRYQKGKTNLDFTEARDSEWQWHQVGHMQVCTSLQTDNHASIPPLSFLQAGCSSCRPTNSVKALNHQSIKHPERCTNTLHNSAGGSSRE